VAADQRLVVIPDVEVRALMAMIEQLDDVVRELALISTGAASGRAGTSGQAGTTPTAPPLPPLPPQTVLLQTLLLGTMETSRAPLFAAKEEISRQVTAAWRAGRAHMDVALDLPTSAAGLVTAFLAALERADTADSALLVPPAPPEAAAFRRWFFAQVVGQLTAGQVAGP
jgi:hypothetical protein